MAAVGTYLCIFDAKRFLQGTVPATALFVGDNYEVEPLIQMLLTNIGALYLLFAIFEGVVLRVTRERSVWLVVLAAMATCDIGHC